MLGGTTTVGSAASLGWGLRMTAAGGVSCALKEKRGSRPLEAGRGFRSPPPPDFLVEAGNVTLYGAMSSSGTSSTTRLGCASTACRAKGRATRQSTVACTSKETPQVRLI